MGEINLGNKEAEEEARGPPMGATRLPEELMSSVLAFLRMKDLLEWRIVANSTKSM